MKERIQKILSARGVSSRRHAEEMIVAGRVTCNGIICKLGDCADLQEDIIFIDGKPLPPADEHIYLLLNKPRGYVTTLSDEKGRKNVAELVKDCNKRVYPIGRLDMDSEGLLLFTNDGALANKLMHPKHNIDKKYRVVVKGFSYNNYQSLQRPILLDGYRIRKPEVTLLSTAENGVAEIEIVIHEGRNRQVRRMCAAAGMAVKKLVRIAEGSVELGDLPCGCWRYLTDAEINSLHK